MADFCSIAEEGPAVRTNSVPLESAIATRPQRNALLSNAFQFGVGQAIRRCSRILFFFCVARKLGPELFGLYALLFALMETLALVSGEGFTDYLTREVAKNCELGRELYAKVIQLRCLYVVVLFVPALAFLYAAKYSVDVAANASLLFLVLVSRAPLGAGQGVLRAAQRFGLLLWLEVIQGSVLLAAGAFLLIGTPGLRSAVLADVASAVATGFASVLMVRSLRQPKHRFVVPWRQVLRQTSTFNIYPVIGNIYDRIDVVLLALLVGNVAAGIYAIPYRALGALQLLPFAFTSAVLPSISAIAPNRDDRRLCSHMVGSFYSLALIPVLAVTLVARPLILAVLGSSYAESAPVLRMLIWAIIPMFVNYGLNIFLLARSQEKMFLWTTAICAVVNVTANVILIPRFSYYAAAAVTILTEVILLIQNLVIIRRTFGFVPVLDKFWETSAVFIILLGGGVISSVHVPAPWSATAALALFGAYLCSNGYVRSVLAWAKRGVVIS